MKILKYLTYSLALILMVASCEKHEILFPTTPVDKNDAMFQLHYFEPINNVAANYIDSVFVNDVIYSSVDGSGQLLPYNGVPGGSAARFFTVKSGEVNLKFYRKGNIVYNQNVSLCASQLSRIDSSFFCNAVFTRTKLSGYWKIALRDEFVKEEDDTATLAPIA